jgi:hypothetical protein
MSLPKVTVATVSAPQRMIVFFFAVGHLRESLDKLNDNISHVFDGLDKTHYVLFSVRFGRSQMRGHYSLLLGSDSGARRKRSGARPLLDVCRLAWPAAALFAASIHSFNPLADTRDLLRAANGSNSMMRM